MAGKTMKARITILAISLVMALFLTSGVLAAPLAVTSPLDTEPFDNANVGSGQINTANKQMKAELTDREPPLTGNPFWAIPLATLSETRERPLFTPSRRAPPPVSARIAASPQPRPVRKPVEPERPRLTLVGTVVGSTEGFGLFIDSGTKDVIRLKTGASYQGWTLRSVREREAILEKDHLDITLSLPRPDSKLPAASPRKTSPLGRKLGEAATSD